MSNRVPCPTCGRRLRIPDHLLGRRVTCPRCGSGVAVPLRETEPPPAAAVSAPDGTDIADWPWFTRLGALSAGLGLVSVLGLCLPLFRYLAPALSGVGLLLGLGALVGAWRESRPAAGAEPGSGIGIEQGFGARARDLPLAGVVACLLALVLALLPMLT